MSKIPYNDLDESQKKALSIVQNEPHRNLFIQGQAGTGKSTLIEHIQDVLKLQGQQYAVVAPSGIAAELIGGTTIHSLFKLDGKWDCFRIDEVKRYTLYQEIVEYIDTLIIDEASMLRADIFDAIDILCQKAKNNAAPFGGIRVILVGDLHQLPPVYKFDSHDSSEYINKTYKAEKPFFFDAFCYAHGNFGFIELTEIHRQDGDNEFIHHLGIIRKGREGNLQDALDYFNRRVINGEPGKEVPVVTARNDEADETNNKRLSELTTQQKTYVATVTGKYNIDRNIVPEYLELKVGARVMICKNHPDGLYVNGTMGVVTQLAENSINVSLDNEKLAIIRRAQWKEEEYYLNHQGKLDKHTIGTFEQFPLKLAYAITIHKSQGQTWDNVCVDLRGGYAFAAGQVYVALSRVRTIEGVHLRRRLTARDILVNPSITKFLKDEGIVRPRHNKENDEAKKEPAIEMVAPDNNLTEYETLQGNKHISQIYTDERKGITYAVWSVYNRELKQDLWLWAGRRDKNDSKAYIFKIPASTFTQDNFVPFSKLNIYANLNPNDVAPADPKRRDIKINLTTFKEMLKPIGQRVNFKRYLWKTIDYDANEVIDNPDYLK